MTDKQDERKKMIADQLRKTPIVQVACEKVGVSRATYYRWRIDDTEFKKASDQALKEGIQLVNDMAESQLLSAIRDKNMTAIIYWLKHHHSGYSERIELAGKIAFGIDQLTAEQELMVQKALSNAGLIHLESELHATED